MYLSALAGRQGRLRACCSNPSATQAGDRPVQLDNVWHMPCRGVYVIRFDGTTCLQLWNSAGQLTRLQGDPLQMASWLQACHDAGFHRGIPGMVTKGRWLFYPQQKACSVTAPRFFMLSKYDD